MLDLLADNFDLVAPVNEFSPRQVPGVITDAPWKLASGINIIIGHSGSGKTRIFEAMKRPLKELDTASVKRAAPTNLSQGQKVFFALETLLQIQPQGSCLMIDDVGNLDRLHMKLWCHQLKRHNKQVIIAMSSIAWELWGEMFNDLPVKLFHLELPPRG